MYTCSDPVDFIEKSVDASLAVKDYPAALQAIAAHWPLVSATHGARLRSLIESLPDDEWRSDAWIIAALGASYRSLGSPSRSAALPFFQAAETLIASGASPVSDLPAVQLHHSAALRSLGMLDSALATAESTWLLLQNELELAFPMRVGLQASAAVQLGLIKLHLGDYNAATAHLRLASGLASGLSEHGLPQADLVECNAGLSFAAYATGEYDEAEKFLARARAAAGNTGLLHSGFGAAALAAEVLIAVDRNEQLAARALAPQLATAAHRSDWKPLALYAQSAVGGITGHLIEALDLQRRSVASVRSWEGVPVIRTMGEILRGGLHLHLGELEPAAALLKGITPTQDHIDCPGRIIAGIRFSTGDFSGCLDELRPCDDLGDSHSSRTLVDVLLLTAGANYELGNLIAGDVAFDRALYLGSQTGLRIPFLIIPRVTMLRMLDRATDRNQPDAVHLLLDELRTSQNAPVQALGPLSERELDIAHHLFQDKTVSQIAAELFISTNTVKTHVRSIYRKLSASTRKEAMKRVRELGLNLKITPF